MKIKRRGFLNLKRLTFLIAAIFVAGAGFMYLFSQRTALAAVMINDASNFNQLPETGRSIVRTSSGTLYVFLRDPTNNTCEIWKSADGTSWTEQNSANHPSCLRAPTAAIDGAGIIHLVFPNGPNLEYLTFNTSNDTFSGVAETLGAGVSADTYDGTVAVDSNNIPHVAYVYYDDFTGNRSITYINRVGGGWSASAPVEAASMNGLQQPDLVINEDNIPEVAYTLEGTTTLRASVGNQNNATSFTGTSLDNNMKPLSGHPSITVDSLGNTWIGYTDETGAFDYASLKKHNDADIWSTWQASVNNSNVAQDLSIATIGTDVYIYYADSLDEISYNRYNGSTWLGTSTLQSSAFSNQVTAKWSSYHDNQRAAQTDYLFTLNFGDVSWDKVSFQALPAAPTLSTPASAATGVSTLPQFQLRTTDGDNDYLRYHIKVYSSQTECNADSGTNLVRSIDQTSSQTGWTGQDTQTSTAYVGNSVITSSTMASHTYQTAALSAGTTYWWKGRAIDPGGSNSFGNWQTCQSFTTNNVPATPTLIQPSSSQTQIPILPQFQLRTTDADNDYLRYHIKVYSAQTECNSDSGTNLIRSIDQTSSQTGWAGQDVQSATAYSGSSTITSSRIAAHNYQSPPLSPNTAYWWKGRAKDPGGTDTWSSWATCTTFTTATTEVKIQGGVNIRGGSRIQ